MPFKMIKVPFYLIYLQFYSTSKFYKEWASIVHMKECAMYNNRRINYSKLLSLYMKLIYGTFFEKYCLSVL